jgi:3-phosphoshikimate 1-carboxyvinyltransferase
VNRYQIKKSSLSGTIKIPPSKSHTLRALVFGLMGKGRTIIDNYLPSPDTTKMIRAIENFGATVSVFPNTIEIEGVGGNLKSPEDVIDAGNSGILLRFIGALAALLPTYTVLTGDLSIRKNREVQPLLEGLSSLGVLATSLNFNGRAPILIKGPIEGGVTHLEGRDSQPVSALLIVSSFLKKETYIHVRNPGETPWIDLTLHWLDFLGLPYFHENYQKYYIPGGGSYSGFHYRVPGDLSSLAFPLAAALITNSELRLQNIDLSDIQGDKKLIEVLIQMGAKISLYQEKKELYIKKESQLRGMEIDINDCIDALPILAVIGCFAKGTTTLYNGAIARKKECDRIHRITTELKKMGADIEEKEDGLIVKTSNLRGKPVKTYEDHRMGLALSVAALGAEGETEVLGTACIAKTYPNFALEFQKLGADLINLS